MISCGEIRLLLGPFDDGELEPHEMEDVAFHVVNCGECKAELEEYRRLGVALRDVVTVPPLDDFAHAVMARLVPARRALHTRGGEWWNTFGRLASVLEFAGVAAMAAAVTLLIAGPDVRRFVTHRGQDAAVNLAVGSAASNRSVEAVVARSGGGSAGAGRGFPSARATVAVASDNPIPPDLNLENLADQGQVKAASNMQEIVSELGAGHTPSVAVWKEPRTDTTVVWVPDQP